MENKPKNHKPMPYQLLPEIDLAKKYFDWKFYQNQKGREPIKTQGDLHRYLMEVGFKGEGSSIHEQNQEKKKEYAKKMDMDNLVKGL